MSRRLMHTLLLAVLGWGGLTYSFVADAAEQYPVKPILLIVPYSAGTNPDVSARIVAQKLTDRLGQRVVVENRVGASGNIGVSAVKRAKPDGYTLVISAGAAVINMALHPDLDFDLSKDFEAISLVSVEPVILMVSPSLPVKTVADLIALAKSKPGELNFASTGAGTTGHVFGEAFESKTGVSMTHVPFKDSATAQADLMSDRVQVNFTAATAGLNVVRSGNARALAIGSPERSPAAPDLPTFAEAGVPGFEAFVWAGILAPKGTPVEIVQRLSKEILATLADPDVVKQMAATGQQIKATSPDDFHKFIDSEIVRWKQVVKDTGMKAE